MEIAHFLFVVDQKSECDLILMTGTRVFCPVSLQPSYWLLGTTRFCGFSGRDFGHFQRDFDDTSTLKSHKMKMAKLMNEYEDDALVFNVLSVSD